MRVELLAGDPGLTVASRSSGWTASTRLIWVRSTRDAAGYAATWPSSEVPAPNATTGTPCSAQTSTTGSPPRSSGRMRPPRALHRVVGLAAAMLLAQCRRRSRTGRPAAAAAPRTGAPDPASSRRSRSSDFGPASSLGGQRLVTVAASASRDVQGLGPRHDVVDRWLKFQPFRYYSVDVIRFVDEWFASGSMRRVSAGRLGIRTRSVATGGSPFNHP